ncbi:GmrSD restriction endonuclease domain-containing protein [Candidatus Hecatella orcuttiae]|uniref:GmrSD restriction endonuclease domain-containing protein n=1 Tax=Candidatus Hecatella orcuttiae TaxID=1935119 RepID=UPI00286821AD|nr:DUF262 domain-containing protein [Candidatus Hecatella orcuttiae]
MSSSKPGLGQEPIHMLIEKAASGKIDIPEFQREFVWTKNQVADLLDSLIKGYPIGSILVWDLSDYTQGKHVYENKSKEWMVDGQQRIVALCILNLRKPYWLDINIWNDLVKKYRVKINILTLEVSLEYPAIKQIHEWVSPYDIFNAEDIKKLAEELSYKLNRPELFTKIYDNASKIKAALNMDIPVIKINTSLENIATIFERLNSSGTRIKQADITLAYVAAYNEGWVREEFSRYLDSLDEGGFYFDPTLLVRAITSVGEDKAILREVSDDFLRNKNNLLDYAFSKFKNSLNRLILEFRNIGILSSELIYAKNTIIPLIYLRCRFENQFEFKKAFLFFLLALWQGRYSGSAETTLQEDINKIKNSRTFGEAVNQLIGELRVDSINKEAIKNAIHYQGEGRFFKLLLYLITYRNEAVDWFTGVRIGYTTHNEINKDFTIEEHHFFPRSLLRSVGIKKEERELLGNITFINPGTNKRLRYQPYTYIQKYGIDKSELQKQLIPLDENLWKLQNYKDFIEKRSELIAEEINKFLKP